MEFIIYVNLPIRTVSQPKFKNLLEVVAGRNIKMPSRYSIQKQLNREFNEGKTKLKNLLRNQTFVCTTADVWSKRAQAYLGVTVHFIDHKYVRHSYLLAFRRLHKRQTHEYLGQQLYAINKEFNLSLSQITHTITDGGSNFRAAFRKFASNEAPEIIAEDADEYDDDNADDNDDDFDAFNNDTPSIDLLRGNTINPNMDSNDESDAIYAQGVVANIIDLDEFVGSDTVIFDEIVLPPQLRCFAHLLNLIGKYDFMKYLKNNDEEVHNILQTVFKKLKLIWNAYAKRPTAKIIVQNEYKKIKSSNSEFQ